MQIKLTQSHIILSHLKKHGYISRLIANHYLIGDLRKRISELREAGHMIESVKLTDDFGRTYTKYTYHGMVSFSVHPKYKSPYRAA